MDYAQLVERLDAVMPEGLHILSAAEAEAKPGDLAAARYRLTLSCPPETVRAALAQPQLNVEKKTKKKTMKTVDIRPFFADAEIAADGEGTVMLVTLPNSSSETVNPGLFATALNAFSGENYRCDVLRLQILLADGTEFT